MEGTESSTRSSTCSTGSDHGPADIPTSPSVLTPSFASQPLSPYIDKCDNSDPHRPMGSMKIQSNIPEVGHIKVPSSPKGPFPRAQSGNRSVRVNKSGRGEDYSDELIKEAVKKFIMEENTSREVNSLSRSTSVASSLSDLSSSRHSNESNSPPASSGSSSPIDGRSLVTPVAGVVATNRTGRLSLIRPDYLKSRNQPVESVNRFVDTPRVANEDHSGSDDSDIEESGELQKGTGTAPGSPSEKLGSLKKESSLSGSSSGSPPSVGSVSSLTAPRSPLLITEAPIDLNDPKYNALFSLQHRRLDVLRKRERRPEKCPRTPLAKGDQRWSSSSSCQLCAVKFTVMRRKHHCRGCGRVLCGSCTPYDFLDLSDPVLSTVLSSPQSSATLLGGKRSRIRTCVFCHALQQGRVLRPPPSNPTPELTDRSQALVSLFGAAVAQDIRRFAREDTLSWLDAVTRGNIYELHLRLACGQDPNEACPSLDGMTALHLAASQTSSAVINPNLVRLKARDYPYSNSISVHPNTNLINSTNIHSRRSPSASAESNVNDLPLVSIDFNVKSADDLHNRALSSPNYFSGYNLDLHSARSSMSVSSAPYNTTLRPSLQLSPQSVFDYPNTVCTSLSTIRQKPEFSPPFSQVTDAEGPLSPAEVIQYSLKSLEALQSQSQLSPPIVPEISSQKLRTLSNASAGSASSSASQKGRDKDKDEKKGFFSSLSTAIRSSFSSPQSPRFSSSSVAASPSLSASSAGPGTPGEGRGSRTSTRSGSFLALDLPFLQLGSADENSALSSVSTDGAAAASSETPPQSLDSGPITSPEGITSGSQPILTSNMAASARIIIETLLQAGADPNRLSLSGRTPLHFAVLFGDFAIVDTLLRAGAVQYIKDKNGLCAIDYIRLRTQKLILQKKKNRERAKDKVREPRTAEQDDPLDFGGIYVGGRIEKLTFRELNQIEQRLVAVHATQSAELFAFRVEEARKRALAVEPVRTFEALGSDLCVTSEKVPQVHPPTVLDVLSASGPPKPAEMAQTVEIKRLALPEVVEDVNSVRSHLGILLSAGAPTVSLATLRALQYTATDPRFNGALQPIKVEPVPPPAPELAHLLSFENLDNSARTLQNNLLSVAALDDKRANMDRWKGLFLVGARAELLSRPALGLANPSTPVASYSTTEDNCCSQCHFARSAGPSMRETDLTYVKYPRSSSLHAISHDTHQLMLMLGISNSVPISSSSSLSPPFERSDFTGLCDLEQPSAHTAPASLSRSHNQVEHVPFVGMALPTLVARAEAAGLTSTHHHVSEYTLTSPLAALVGDVWRLGHPSFVSDVTEFVEVAMEHVLEKEGKSGLYSRPVGLGAPGSFFCVTQDDILEEGGADEADLLENDGSFVGERLGSKSLKNGGSEDDLDGLNSIRRSTGFVSSTKVSDDVLPSGSEPTSVSSSVIIEPSNTSSIIEPIPITLDPPSVDQVIASATTNSNSDADNPNLNGTPVVLSADFSDFITNSPELSFRFQTVSSDPSVLSLSAIQSNNETIVPSMELNSFSPASNSKEFLDAIPQSESIESMKVAPPSESPRLGAMPPVGLLPLSLNLAGARTTNNINNNSSASEVPLSSQESCSSCLESTSIAAPGGSLSISKPNLSGAGSLALRPSSSMGLSISLSRSADEGAGDRALSLRRAVDAMPLSVVSDSVDGSMTITPSDVTPVNSDQHTDKHVLFSSSIILRGLSYDSYSYLDGWTGLMEEFQATSTTAAGSSDQLSLLSSTTVSDSKQDDTSLQSPSSPKNRLDRLLVSSSSSGAGAMPLDSELDAHSFVPEGEEVDSLKADASAFVGPSAAPALRTEPPLGIFIKRVEESANNNNINNTNNVTSIGSPVGTHLHTPSTFLDVKGIDRINTHCPVHGPLAFSSGSIVSVVTDSTRHPPIGSPSTTSDSTSQANSEDPSKSFLSQSSSDTHSTCTSITNSNSHVNHGLERIQISPVPLSTKEGIIGNSPRSNSSPITTISHDSNGFSRFPSSNADKSVRLHHFEYTLPQRQVHSTELLPSSLTSLDSSPFLQPPSRTRLIRSISCTSDGHPLRSIMKPPSASARQALLNERRRLRGEPIEPPSIEDSFDVVPASGFFPTASPTSSEYSELTMASPEHSRHSSYFSPDVPSSFRSDFSAAQMIGSQTPTNKGYGSTVAFTKSAPPQSNSLSKLSLRARTSEGSNPLVSPPLDSGYTPMLTPLRTPSQEHWSVAASPLGTPMVRKSVGLSQELGIGVVQHGHEQGRLFEVVPSLTPANQTPLAATPVGSMTPSRAPFKTSESEVFSSINSTIQAGGLVASSLPIEDSAVLTSPSSGSRFGTATGTTDSRTSGTMTGTDTGDESNSASVSLCDSTSETSSTSHSTPTGRIPQGRLAASEQYLKEAFSSSLTESNPLRIVLNEEVTTRTKQVSNGRTEYSTSTLEAVRGTLEGLSLKAKGAITFSRSKTVSTSISMPATTSDAPTVITTAPKDEGRKDTSAASSQPSSSGAETATTSGSKSLSGSSSCSIQSDSQGNLLYPLPAPDQVSLGAPGEEDTEGVIIHEDAYGDDEYFVDAKNRKKTKQLYLFGDTPKRFQVLPSSQAQSLQIQAPQDLQFQRREANVFEMSKLYANMVLGRETQSTSSDSQTISIPPQCTCALDHSSITHNYLRHRLSTASGGTRRSVSFSEKFETIPARPVASPTDFESESASPSTMSMNSSPTGSPSFGLASPSGNVGLSAGSGGKGVNFGLSGKGSPVPSGLRTHRARADVPPVQRIVEAAAPDSNIAAIQNILVSSAVSSLSLKIKNENRGGLEVSLSPSVPSNASNTPNPALGELGGNSRPETDPKIMQSEFTFDEDLEPELREQRLSRLSLPCTISPPSCASIPPSLPAFPPLPGQETKEFKESRPSSISGLSLNLRVQARTLEPEQHVFSGVSGENLDLCDGGEAESSSPIAKVVAPSPKGGLVLNLSRPRTHTPSARSISDVDTDDHSSDAENDLDINKEYEETAEWERARRINLKLFHLNKSKAELEAEEYDEMKASILPPGSGRRSYTSSVSSQGRSNSALSVTAPGNLGGLSLGLDRGSSLNLGSTSRSGILHDASDSPSHSYCSSNSSSRTIASRNSGSPSSKRLKSGSARAPSIADPDNDDSDSPTLCAPRAKGGRSISNYTPKILSMFLVRYQSGLSIPDDALDELRFSGML